MNFGIQLFHLHYLRGFCAPVCSCAYIRDFQVIVHKQDRLKVIMLCKLTKEQIHAGLGSEPPRASLDIVVAALEPKHIGCLGRARNLFSSNIVNTAF